MPAPLPERRKNMQQNYLPDKKRDCPHCGAKQSLRYYKEYDLADNYYCEKCYRLVIWNGNNVIKCDGEAYPNRQK